MATCPNCSANLPADARFCLACGHPIDPGATRTSGPFAKRGSGSSSDSGSASSSDSFDHGRFAPGTRLGERYRIVGRLGVGGMGEVYRADDLKLGQPVALKFLPESVERDPERLEKLLVEIRTARQISHPNVCRVYDVGEVDGRRFLTMEYVDGEDLKGLLRRIGRLPEDKGLEIARQVCAGLAAMHDRGVLHRDLKPANVMLDGRGKVRLTDFGLATAAAGAGADGEIAGTPAYMAPEQLAGGPLSVATDLYALGLVLFEIFTGERLQTGENVAAVREAQRRVQSTLTSTASGAKLDPIISRVIERCLESDPARRPQSAIIVAAALPGGDPLAAALAAGETPSPQMVAAAGSEGGLSFAIAVPLLAVLVAGVFVLAWENGRRSYAAEAAFPFSPEVLDSKAGEILTRLGYTDNVGSSAGGMGSYSSDYSAWINQHDTTPARWDHIGSVRPALVRYWRRTSPEPLVPQDYFGNTPGGGLAVKPNDPPPTRPGMTYMELDPEGRLVSFDAVLPDKRATDEAAPAPDWSALFEEAGLDFAAFAPVEPEWTSHAESDVSGAWTGPGADEAGAELRVEAALYQGRVVFFRLIAPWTRPAGVAAAGGPEGVAQRILQVILLALFVAVPLTAIGLSVRNLRLGRTDTRGATRLAAVIGVVVAAAALLGSQVAAGVAWLPSSFMLASWVGFSALLIAAFYLAVEPYVRRHWPRMLISWSRLVDGRWRDPLVGRDLLVGTVVGVLLSLIGLLTQPIAELRGGLPPMPTVSTTGWIGTRQAAADLLASLPEVMWISLGLVVLLVLLRTLLRRELLAALVVALLFTALMITNATDPLVDGVAGLVVGLILVTIPTRFGLVMFVSFMYFNQAGLMVHGFATPEFATGSFVLGVLAALAPGVFGFYTATRGRKASAWLDE